MRFVVAGIFSVCLACSIQPLWGFLVYWNVPSATCLNRGIKLDLDKYGITYNHRQKFIGEKVRTFYRPGYFPHISANGTEINGIIPQLGDLQKHLKTLIETIKQEMPDLYATGPAVIDFEKWKPSFNYSSKAYRELSWRYAKASFNGRLTWPQILRRAERQFEYSAKLFLGLSLANAAHMRPFAGWGYYQYPLCNNYHTPSQPCPITAKEELRRHGWLYQLSRTLYPSIYLHYFNSPDQRRDRVKHHLDKAQAVARGKPIIPFTWFQYHSKPDLFLTKTDLFMMLSEPFARNFSGVIMWGSSANVNTRERCLKLKDYLDKYMGPLVKHLVTMTTDKKHAWIQNMETAKGRQRLMNSIKWSE